MMKNTAILLIDCPDRKGLVAAIGEFLYRHEANIVHADQHQDPARGLFLMRVEWDLQGFDFDLSEFPIHFRPMAAEYNLRWRLQRSDTPQRIALFVSKFDHCLADLLYRHQAGELACEIPLIISNHREAERWAKFHDVEYIHTPSEARSKADIEREQLKLCADYKIDLIVLARYMQVLSAEFIQQHSHRIINVHHSFLPAFSGAKPYHRAFARGVKLIGATSHYATEVLDDGPIIEQDVVRISHRDSLEELIEKGRDLEKIVLSRAVRWHLDHRVLVYGNKTVVFD